MTKTFTEILASRGRVVLFTPNATVGLRFEQVALRNSMPVIHTRGWADPYGPLGEWARVHTARDRGVLSCDQHRYVTGMKIPATDLVWVGPIGTPNGPESHLFHRYLQAMARAEHLEFMGTTINKWLLTEDQL